MKIGNMPLKRMSRKDEDKHIRKAYPVVTL